MKDRDSDRRIKRTRQLLHNALIELILEKRYESITVQDIIDRADVGRSTFYAHYQDKDDLFSRGFGEVLGELNRNLEQDHSEQLLPSLTLFYHAREHYQLYKALVRGQGMELAFKTGTDYLGRSLEQRLGALLPAGQTPAIPLPVLVTYVIGAFLSLLKWWLDSNMPCSPEQMDDMFSRLVMPGISAATEDPLKR